MGCLSPAWLSSAVLADLAGVSLESLLIRFD